MDRSGMDIHGCYPTLTRQKFQHLRLPLKKLTHCRVSTSIMRESLACTPGISAMTTIAECFYYPRAPYSL